MTPSERSLKSHQNDVWNDGSTMYGYGDTVIRSLICDVIVTSRRRGVAYWGKCFALFLKGNGQWIVPTH